MSTRRWRLSHFKSAFPWSEREQACSLHAVLLIARSSLCLGTDRWSSVLGKNGNRVCHRSCLGTLPKTPSALPDNLIAPLVVIAINLIACPCSVRGSPGECIHRDCSSVKSDHFLLIKFYLKKNLGDILKIHPFGFRVRYDKSVLAECHGLHGLPIFAALLVHGHSIDCSTLYFAIYRFDIPDLNGMQGSTLLVSAGGWINKTIVARMIKECEEKYSKRNIHGKIFRSSWSL